MILEEGPMYRREFSQRQVIRGECFFSSQQKFSLHMQTTCLRSAIWKLSEQIESDSGDLLKGI